MSEESEAPTLQYKGYEIRATPLQLPESREWTFDSDSFFFDYDRLVRIVIRRGAAPELTEVAFSPKRFAAHREGTRIVLTSAEENRGFVVDGNTIQYVENGKPLRTYRRIGERAAPDATPPCVASNQHVERSAPGAGTPLAMVPEKSCGAARSQDPRAFLDRGARGTA